MHCCLLCFWSRNQSPKQPLIQAQKFPKPTSKDQEKAKEVIVVFTHFPFYESCFLELKLTISLLIQWGREIARAMCYGWLSYGAAAFFPLQYTPDWVTCSYLTMELFLLCYVKYTHAQWEGSHADAFHEQTLCAENIVWLCFQFLIPFEIIVCASNSRSQFQSLQYAGALTRL